MGVNLSTILGETNRDTRRVLFLTHPVLSYSKRKRLFKKEIFTGTKLQCPQSGSNNTLTIYSKPSKALIIGAIS